jgi:hypothetical protein
MFAFWRDVAGTFAVEAVYDLVKHVDALAKEKWASPHRQEEKVRSAQISESGLVCLSDYQD